MVFKRLIGLVFAGAMTFSAVAADIVVRPAVTMCGFPGTNVGMATPTPGPREGGNSLHVRVPTG